MSRQKFVMGNWKMHGNKATVHALLQHIKNIQLEGASAQIVVFPPYPYIEKSLWELRHSNIAIGGQDISPFENGAYTGDVSGEMLKDIGCDFVLIGHSERRQLYAETDDLIKKKCIRAFKAGLRPVLCVGETHQQRQEKLTEKMVLAQLQSVLHLPDFKAYLPDLVVAYEPVWAIGTGLSATPKDVQAVHCFLREVMSEYDEKLAQNAIIYGGSVKANNAKSLFDMPDVDGALVGGASLDGEAFREICHLIEA